MGTVSGAELTKPLQAQRYSLWAYTTLQEQNPARETNVKAAKNAHENGGGWNIAESVFPIDFKLRGTIHLKTKPTQT